MLSFVFKRLFFEGNSELNLMKERCCLSLLLTLPILSW
jgi:hypothetical protein